MSTIELAAVNLAAARRRQRETKEALRAYREVNGSCPLYSNELPYERRSCFQTREPMAEWCEVCRGSQPLWGARRQAARDAGAALQRLMRICAHEGVA